MGLGGVYLWEGLKNICLFGLFFKPMFQTEEALWVSYGDSTTHGDLEEGLAKETAAKTQCNEEESFSGGWESRDCSSCRLGERHWPALEYRPQAGQHHCGPQGPL